MSRSDFDSNNDSDTDSGRPSDHDIQKTLCNTVAKLFKAGDLDILTLKRVRSDAASKLDLTEDFFKTDAKWKDKSKEIVHGEVARLEAASPVKPKNTATSVSSPTPVKPKKRAAPKAKKEEQPKPKSKPSAKRKSLEPPKLARKRQRTIPESDTEGELTPVQDSDADEADEEKSSPASIKSPAKSPQKPVIKDASDSEMSVLLDDPPAPKAKRRKAPSSEKGEKPVKSKPPAKAKTDSTVSPQDEEIKRLQSWLIKCGVRKLWGKELAAFSSPREKVSHLKGLLRDVGMEGRFSEDKARQIKEERELKADLEDIVERERKWGQVSGDEESGDDGEAKRKPKRRLAKGLRELEVFAGDEEESD